jgi:hypothetical protein
MQGDTQIRVHKIGKNSASFEEQPRARGLERSLHDAMELRMVTIEILGVSVHARTLGKWWEVGIICATLGLG